MDNSIMEIFYFDGEEFRATSYLDILGQIWLDGEPFDEFLTKCGFNNSPDKFGGFIDVYSRDGCHTNQSKALDGFFIDINYCEYPKHLFVFHFIDLLKLFKFLGMNFHDEMAKKYMYSRVLERNEICEDLTFLSVIPITEEKVYVTSYEPIQTNEEIYAYRRRMRDKRTQEYKESQMKNKKDY